MKSLRFNNILKSMENHNLEQMLITSPASIFYLTGRWVEPGERLMVLYINSNGNSRLFINELFPIDEDLGVDIEIYNDRDDSIEILSRFIENKKLGIEKSWPSHFLIRLMENKQGLSFIDGSPIIDKVRMIKDEEEIHLMREATRINDRVMGDIVDLLREDYDERAVCKILRDVYEKYETFDFSFNPLIAYGGNCAEPHHDSDNTKLKQGDSIIIDIGGITNRYCSDMTRTVFYNNISDEQKKVYNLVLEANMKAIEAIKPGIRLCDIDMVARTIIDNGGYGKYFIHRTGHNIGIDVHEFPDVSSSSQLIVEKGMIFSIEPGIYIPGSFGVRIEDLVLVTDSGYEVLNSYSKDLKLIGSML